MTASRLYLPPRDVMQKDKVKAAATKTRKSSAESRCGAIIFLTMRRIAITTEMVPRHPNTTAVVSVECSDNVSLPSWAGKPLDCRRTLSIVR